MTTRRSLRSLRILSLLPAAAIAATLAVSFGPAPAAHADGWVDGGDEFPCLDDVTCLWIQDCELDENQHPIYPNRNGKTSYPAGSYSYKGDKPTTPKPTPTPTPTPSTPKPGGKPTKPSTGGTGGGSTGGTGTGTGTTDPLSPTPSAGATEQVAAGAPSALAAPTLTVEGKTVTVSWAASPNAEIEQVTGYLIRFTGQEAVETDADTLTYVFKNVEPGSYRAAVWARNAAGESAGSPPSEPVVVGVDPTTVQGTVTVTGDLAPGATVTVTGTGFAPRIEGYALELHSDPVPLGEVKTDDNGGFTADVVVPANVVAGDHQLVVLFEGAEVATSPVTVAAAAGTPSGDEASADVAHTGDDAEPIPDHAGLLILGALGAAGALSLVWRLARGRRRPSGPLAAHKVVPHVS
ncbi:fibronectin type III domain-containing protein [Pimelobacter simplex]|uniref:fibronectin type III domain-containing protein n=1 Tax=Nocardioides simplex TaxID=2045 RepID=UPI00366B96AA